jgi:5-formyltetrahydrofolate cyclo-ligase
MFYASCDYEVVTDGMIKAALKAGKRVVVPLVNKAEERTMSAVAVTDLQKDLCIGTFGVREPLESKAVEPGSIDLVIVPAIAFDFRGHRLGYGKGYYDTWLQRFPIEKRIGLAYELQVVERLPFDGNDLPVGVIVTEMRTLRTKSLKVMRKVSGPKVIDMKGE